MVILMDEIKNDHFLKFCSVVKRSMIEPANFEKCLTNMIDASLDDNRKIYVYADDEYNMQVLKLDEYTKDFEKKRRPIVKENISSKREGNNCSYQPNAVDAVCVNKSNEWFLIEFKNQKLNVAVSDSIKKMLSSVWLIAYMYSTLSENISDEQDILKFSREHITFITIVNSEENSAVEEAIGATWEKDGAFYTPGKFARYKGYYFKDAYVLTEKGLRSFIKYFDK